MLKITNEETGIVFNVRRESENGKTSVRFFDSRYVNERWPNGQPVSNYYAETFNALRAGLLLAGECPRQWYLTAANVQRVQAYLMEPLPAADWIRAARTDAEGLERFNLLHPDVQQAIRRAMHKIAGERVQ